MISKKVVMCVLLAGVLVFGAGAGAMGTRAKYQKELGSTSNEISTAKFVIDQVGITTENLSLGKVDPMMNNITKTFSIKKTTEVPVKYNITITPKGKELFDEETPINYVLKNGDTRLSSGKFTSVKDIVFNDFVPADDTEQFTIEFDWVENDSTDLNYAGMTGTFDVQVVAVQTGRYQKPTV